MPQQDVFVALCTIVLTVTIIYYVHPEAATQVYSSLTAKDRHACTINITFADPFVEVSMVALPWNELEEKFSYLLNGGHYIPRTCDNPHRVAVIVPYRDRETHLHVLLNNIHPFLTEQQLDYSIFLVEQTANQTFNRGKLLNIGFVEAMKIYDWQCILLHDVDLLPEDRRNIHLCPELNPRFMAVAMDKRGYNETYKEAFGTSSMLSVKQFRDVNGLSNYYWGWGGEDDDFYNRTRSAGYKVERYNSTIGRYKMIKHRNDKGNPVNRCRFKLLNLTHQWKVDGLNSLQYRLVSMTLKPLYTHILVDLLESKERPVITRNYC